MYITNFRSDEFFKFSHEPFIVNRESTNLLNSLLSEEFARITVAKLFIENLAKSNKSKLSTEFHTNWAMECIGYAFSFPMEYYSTIEQAISIYKTWLLSPEKAPGPVKAKREHYEQEILCHFSIMFTRRKDTRKQIELCKKVLETIETFVRFHEVSEKTWECLLMLLMLVLDQTLKNYTELADVLCSKMLKVFFEVWIRSNCRNKILWKHTRQYLNEWIDHQWVITHWASVMIALTTGVLKIVYCNKFEVIQVTFSPDSRSFEDVENVKISLTQEQTIYFWYRFLDVIVNETKANVKLIPDLHATLARAITSIVGLMLEICNERMMPVYGKTTIQKSQEKGTECQQALDDCIRCFCNAQFNYNIGLYRLPMPSINSILDIFGEWLFYHAQVISAYDVFGKSEVVSCLCRIFSQAQGPPKEEYLNKFYNILLEILASNDQRVVGEILKNSVELISTNHLGIDFVLRPDGFIGYLEVYLTEKDTEICIRNACYKMLSVFCALPKIYKLRELSGHILEIFLGALGLEDETENFSILIWSMCTYASTVHNDRDTLHSILCSMVDRLGSIDYKDKHLYNILLSGLTLLPYLINTKIVTAQVASRNIQNLFEYIPKRGKSSDEDQTSGLLMALCNWLNCFPAALLDDELRNGILKILENRKKIEKFRVLAEKIRVDLLNSLNRPGQDSINVMTLTKKSVSEKKRRHYLLVNCLYSFIEEEHVIGIKVRNSIGVFGWKLRMVTSPSIKKLDLNFNALDYSKQPNKIIKSHREIQVNLYDELTQEEQKEFSRLEGFMKRQINVQIKSKTKRKESNIQECNLSRRPAFHRIFLAQLGMLELDNLKGTIPLLPRELSTFVEKFDKISEKEVVVLPVFFLMSPESDEISIINKDNCYSTGFSELLQNIGVLITAHNNPYPQIRKYIERFDQVIYRSNDLFEAVIVSPALISAEKSTLAKFISKFTVLVFWNERSNDPHTRKIPNIIQYVSSLKKIGIVLTSITHTLTRINIYGDYPKSGPLLDGMVIPNMILPNLLLFTVYGFKSSIDSFTKNWEKRTNFLKEKSQNSHNFTTVLNYLFS